jgi:twitching motility protein PilT
VEKPRGLILITGATGTGKSTTLASLIQHLNENFSIHILTLEDPIEFLFQDRKASITQREVGIDISAIAEGVLGGLRQDPDVMVIGEMRDQQTIQAALTAAETGHLVISTLHTNDAKSSIERILDIFPAEAQNQIRVQLASVLLGVISQQLVTRKNGKGRVAACEVLIKSPTVETCILKNEVNQIPEVMAQSQDHFKMQTMNQALQKLVETGEISPEEALCSSMNPEDLRLKLSGVGRDEGYYAKVA